VAGRDVSRKELGMPAWVRALWHFGVFASIPKLARLAYLGLGFWFPQNLSDKDPSFWVSIAALGLAGPSSHGAIGMLISQRKRRECRMIRLANAAVEMTTPFDLPGILRNDEFIRVCVQLSEDNEEENQERKKKEKEFGAAPGAPLQ
jgi:hypothetical protein